MHVHILGICGTFMGGVAVLAKQLGWQVSGCDANVYPPMSDQLREQGIQLTEGYAAEQLPDDADYYVVGNAISRGNPALEHILDQGWPYTSGPQWLAEHILAGRWVLAVAGTHGKTTTSSMLAWILEYAKMAPGFLIGGVPANFAISARLGDTPFFVVEADEYDSAFCDKRSKFVHYRPRTAILNNLEFDHADIFPDLAAIQRQFHHLVRTIPASGQVIWPQAETGLAEVIQQGCWSTQVRLGAEADWQAKLLAEDGSHFQVWLAGELQGEVQWSLLGQHNVDNALAAMAAARHAGVTPTVAMAALAEFLSVKRRMELRGQVAGVTVYDDFAHHPTAIATTLAGLRRHVGAARIIAVLEPRSNTMRMGVHQAALAQSLKDADQVWVLQPPGLDWSAAQALADLGGRLQVTQSVEHIVETLPGQVQSGDHILVMSNGGFGGIHQKLLDRLQEQADD